MRRAQQKKYDYDKKRSYSISKIDIAMLKHLAVCRCLLDRERRRTRKQNSSVKTIVT